MNKHGNIHCQQRWLMATVAMTTTVYISGEVDKLVQLTTWVNDDWWLRDMASCTQALISLLVSVEQIARSCFQCRVERRVVMWVRCNIIVLAATAWLESLCRRGRVVVVVDCSAVECDVCSSQRPTRDLHCLTTSNQALWRRRRLNAVLHRGRLLHSPTYTVNDLHWLTVPLCVIVMC